MAQVLGKRKSSVIEELQNTNHENGASVTTPTGSPSRKRTKITQPQKQALIDNLQLESTSKSSIPVYTAADKATTTVTERARHLRAHYSLQGSDLRSRVERRVNRIPVNLRKATMSNLLAKHSAPTPAKKPIVPPKSPRHSPVKPKTNHPLPPLPQSTSSQANSPARHTTRKAATAGEDFTIISDKENGPLPNPKNPKRAKTTTATTKTTTTVLSPKSHNSRTLPRSPVKDLEKAPASPTKSSSPLKHATSALFHGIVRKASKDKALKTVPTTSKTMPPPPAPRPGVGDRAASSLSTTSATSSNATTVVTKAKTRPGKTTISQVSTAKTTIKTASAASKTGPRSGASVVARKGTVRGGDKEKENAGGGRRVLRKRN